MTHPYVHVVRVGRVLQGGLSLALLAVLFAIPMVDAWGTDARGYWSAFDGGLYHLSWQSVEGAAFVYPPPAALVLWPFSFLPFPTFYALLVGADIAALCWLVGWRWAGIVAVLYFPALRDILDGNIHILMAAALTLGAWPFLLLTKVTPGLGLITPALRREWRTVTAGFAITVALVVLSVAILGTQAWAEWWAVIVAGAGHTDHGSLLSVPFLVRLPIAGACFVAAARWRWLLALGAMLALPAVWWGAGALLLAIPRLRRADRPTASHR